MCAAYVYLCRIVYLCLHMYVGVACVFVKMCICEYMRLFVHV